MNKKISGNEFGAPGLMARTDKEINKRKYGILRKILQ